MMNKFLNCFLPIGRLALVVLAVSFAPINALAQDLSFEAELASLYNGAAIQNCGSCSGGSQVGNLGGNQNGHFISDVTAPEAGFYDLVLHYSSGDPRTIYLSINDGAGIEIPCTASGGWTTVATTAIQVEMNEGTNSLKFYNNGGWAPNIDKFTLTPSRQFHVSGIISQDGEGLSGITVALNGASSATTVTDEGGYYEFNTLVEGKNYTITPTADGKVFTPPYLSFEEVSSSMTDQDFEADEICADCLYSFSFGISGEIIYNTQTGTASVISGGKTIIANAHAVVANGGDVHNSLSYANRSITEIEIADDFGTGKKITVALSETGKPNMEQIFYTYSDKDYFLVEVRIVGESVSSNYMAPLVTNSVDIGQQGDNRVLFVPFDNDTFIKYHSKPMANTLTNVSSEATAFYENDSRAGLVVGSVEFDAWKTGVRTSGAGHKLSELAVWGGYTDESVTRDPIPHGAVSGSVVKSPKVFVGYFDDWREGFDEYGKAVAIAQPRYVFNWDRPTPFGWNSWGAIQTDLNLEKAKGVVDFFANQIPAFRSGETAYIDLDSFWDNMVSGGLEGDFSNLISFVQYCKSKGLKPGIYWGPFIDWGKFDRKVEGSDYNYSDVWTKVNGSYHDLDGGRAMDPTHPATKQRIDLVIDKFKKCGFEMIKIDFIGHAAIEADEFYDPSVTTGMQAFRHGMEYLIDKLEGKMLVYAAISPNLATGRYAHSRRIACDAYADIKATEYTLNSVTYGWWQSHIYNYIDADHLVLGNASLGENRARLTSGVICGPLITGDDFSASGQWTERAKTLLQNQDILELARNGKTFRPAEGDTESAASEIFTKEIDGMHYIALINYGEEKEYHLDLTRLNIPLRQQYAKELFAGKIINPDGNILQIRLGARDAAILRLTEGVINDVRLGAADTTVLYPNPASNQVTISCKHPISSFKILYNGAVVNKMEGINRSEIVVNMEQYKDGFYIIHVEDADGFTKTYKVVKN